MMRLAIWSLVWVACTPTEHRVAPPPPTPEGSADSARDTFKRGAAYHFCGWDFSEGGADLEALVPGLSWYYNWSSKPLECPDGKGVGAHPLVVSGDVEFVPMAWGLVDNGRQCASGGPCFRVDERTGGKACRSVCEPSGWSFKPDGPCYACYHEAVSRQQFLDDIPVGAKHLLGFNEPNFKEQANLTPAVAARGWQHVEWVADARKLTIVGPATNFCDPTPGVVHAGSCIDAVAGDTMLGLAWLERFYDACRSDGAAGRTCRIDYQAVHAYSCWGVTWMIDLMKTKAGLRASDRAHCANGVKDADEFGPDCGGNFCRACSSHAREMFSKPVWLTEFATPSDDCRTKDKTVLLERTMAFMRAQLPKLNADPYVYRYAWFMPKVDMATLDHSDLLKQDDAGVLAPLGRVYLGRSR